MTPWRASLLAAGLACGAAGALGGCGSATRYQAADSRVPAAWLLNAPFPPAPVSATLATVIVCGGPGSWKREALWDEYIVTLKNPGANPVTVTAVELEDFSGGRGAAAVDPWKLEHESAERARMFQRTGVAFAREALPVGLGAGLAAGYSGYAAAAGRIVPTVFVDGEALGPPGLAAAAQGPVALSAAASFALVPVLVAERVLANREDRADIEAEFRLRRLALPITLAPGQARAGCWFFPMGPNPRALKLYWQRGGERGAIELSLDFLHGLHVPAGAGTGP